MRPTIAAVSIGMLLILASVLSDTSSSSPDIPSVLPTQVDPLEFGADGVDPAEIGNWTVSSPSRSRLANDGPGDTHAAPRWKAVAGVVLGLHSSTRSTGMWRGCSRALPRFDPATMCLRDMSLAERSTRRRERDRDAFAEPLEAVLRVADPQCWVSTLLEEKRPSINVLCTQRTPAESMIDLTEIRVASGAWREVVTALVANPNVLTVSMREVAPQRTRGIVESTGCAACRIRLSSTCLVSRIARAVPGELEWSVTAPDLESLRRLVQGLRVERCIASIVMINRAPESVQITSHQREVLAAAENLGYFAVPRLAELNDLAKRFHESKEAIRRTILRAERNLAREM